MQSRSITSPRLVPALALLGALAACADAPLAPAPGPGLSPDAPAGVAALECTAQVRTGTLVCTSPRASAGARGDWLLGRQNVDVRLTSTGVAYDSVAQVFSADVTVQNLKLEKLGTDGVDSTGVRVFFHHGPVATSGAGAVAVRNPTGLGTFTAAAQPYFEYPGVLASGAVSAPLRWEWDVPRTVSAFAFRVYVSTPILPVVLFDRQMTGAGRDVWRVALDGSDLAQVTTHAAEDLDPTAAEGTLAFVSYRNGNAELYSMPLAGGTATRLTTTTGSENAPALSPDGTRLAYTSDAAGGVAKLWTANPDGTGAARATTGFGFAGSIEAGPAWAPTGSRLVFTATTNGTADLWDFTLPGSPLLLVTGASTAEVEPAWSPDGEYVAFASNRAPAGDTELYLARLSTGVVTRLTTRTGIDTSPAWTPDGRIVYVAYTGSTPALRWLDPASPAVTHPIATATNNPLRPAVVPF